MFRRIPTTVGAAAAITTVLAMGGLGACLPSFQTAATTETGDAAAGDGTATPNSGSTSMGNSSESGNSSSGSGAASGGGVCHFDTSDFGCLFAP